MAVVNVHKVAYHFEQGGVKSSQDYIDYVQTSTGAVATTTYSAIKTVLSNNSRLRPGTLVIDSVQEVGHGDGALA